MYSMRKVTGRTLLAIAIAGSVGVLGAYDRLFASTTQSAMPADQTAASVQTARDAAQISSTKPSAMAQTSGPILRTSRTSGRPSLDERIQVFAASLNLSEAQKSAVKNILIQRQQEILRIRFDPSMAGSTGIDRFRALQEITVKRIRAVLNEEQKKKYDPLAVRRIPQTQQPSVEDWLKVMTPR